jgi:hypothetical protein
MKANGAGRPRALRGAGGAAVGLFIFLEGGCSSGLPTGAPSSDSPSGSAAAPPSSPSKEISPSVLSAYDAARVRAWDPSRRFKALFRAEASPKVGAIGRGWLSVWWDGATGTLEWRASAPIAGSAKGGVLRKGRGTGGAAEGEAPAEFSSPVPGRLEAGDLIACILGTPDPSTMAALPFEETPGGVRLRYDDSKRVVVVDRGGRVTAMSFPNGEAVALDPGEGVPRRIEANGPDGRAVLALESYGPWPAGEEVPR